ncbi:hypothetical protein [Streptomyces sp. NPDC096323]|uniref:DUF6907 domain-containing protein n=1 Tax=Streptomyces sp. NPDC096323 TaxID=3155822 RepID=UPI00331D0297
MSTERTVTVQTLDHGTVVMPEPAWCAGHDGDRTEMRCDTGHVGAAHNLMYQGHELAHAALVQDPFAERHDRNVGVFVEMGNMSHRLGPAELSDLAAVLVDYAETLRHLARELAAHRADEAR